MIGLKCPDCSCTIPPDATKCPNCGHKYDDVMSKIPAKSTGNGITVSRVGYAIKCEVHEKIYIKASIASAPTRCPFC